MDGLGRKGVTRGTERKTIDQISGIYTITEEKNGYGKLKSGVGWVKLDEVKRV